MAPVGSPIISLLTIGVLVSFNDSFIFSINRLFISSTVVLPSISNTKSINEPSATGTLYAPPISFPSNSGITFPIALAAPVDVGIIF